MRKSHLFVATLLLAAGAVSITGCLDNDEPLGIQELRSAKAELYRAQAALKTAEIGLKEANIKLKEAEVAHKTALTRTIELENQMREIDLLLKQDSSSAESARLQLQKNSMNCKWIPCRKPITLSCCNCNKARLSRNTITTRH